MRKLVVPPAKKAWLKLSTKFRFKLRRNQQHRHLMLESSEKEKKNRSLSNKSSSCSKRGVLFVNHIKRTAGALSSILFYRRSRRPRNNRYPTLNASASLSYRKQPRNTNSMSGFDCCNNHLQKLDQGVPPPPPAEAAELLDQHGLMDEESPAFTCAAAAAATATLRGFPDADRKKEVEEEESKTEEGSDEELLQEHHRRPGPQSLVGVDLRAELFISSFREEMRLQRQRSFTEYQERLDRSI